MQPSLVVDYPKRPTAASDIGGQCRAGSSCFERCLRSSACLRIPINGVACLQQPTEPVVAEAKKSSTLVGVVGDAWRTLLPFVGPGAAEDLPVEMLLSAIEVQGDASRHLGAFMLLIVKCDAANAKTIRVAWERHGRPGGLRALLEAEVANGVQQPTRLEEGSAALALLWSLRMKEFWLRMATGLADEKGPNMNAVGLEAYETYVEPYHGWTLRRIFRTSIRGLPGREYLLAKMEMPPPAGDVALPKCTAAELRARCLRDLIACLNDTQEFVQFAKAMLDELQLKDDRRL